MVSKTKPILILSTKFNPLIRANKDKSPPAQEQGKNKTEKPHYDNEPKPSNKRNLRRLDIRSSKLADVRKNILACIDESPDTSTNLKKFAENNKNAELKDFFKAMKDLTNDEKNVIRNCRRKAFKSKFQPKVENSN